MQKRRIAQKWNHFWHGWNLALDATWQAVAEIPPNSLTPDANRLRTQLLRWIQERFPDEELLRRQPSNAQLAKKYGVSARTVTNWRKADCPFEDGQWRVLDWLSERRIVPAGARAKFSRQLERRKGPDPDSLEGLRQTVTVLLREAKAIRRVQSA